MATPCPVEGLVVEDDRPHDVTWLSWALGAKQPSERYQRTSLTVFASAPAPTSQGGPATEPLLVMPVRPVVVLDDVYKAVGERLGHDGSPFIGAVCNVSTMEPLTLAELHSGKDVVACIETTKACPTDEATSIPVPPGPPPRLIGKNADDLMPNLIVSHLKISKTYGPICRLYLPPSTDAVLISDPEMAEEILMSPEVWGKTHMKHQKMVRTFVGTGLFTSDDDEDIWHVAHRILLPAFSNQSMRGRYFDMVQHTVGELFEKWDALADGQQPVDLVTWAERFTLDIIGKVAFSQTFGAVTKGKHDYLDILQRQVDISQELQSMTYAHKLLHLSGMMKRWEACCSDQRVFVEDIVSTRKKELENGVDTQRTDLLTLMLTAKDPKTGQNLPDDNVTFQILTFLFAGHDTTSSAITMLFAMIAQHGHVEAKVLEEIERVVGSEDALTFEKLGKLEYCTAVINETLRMFPPAAAPRKTANEDTRLGPYSLPRGTAAFITTWGLAHNPDVWPDPWRFDPDRWLGEEAKTRNAFASVPFSYGPRGCIGRQLSIMEQRSILVHAVRRYHIRLHSLSRPSITNPLLMKPHGFYLSLERRACTPSPMPVTPFSKADASAALPPPCLSPRALSAPSKGSRVVVLYGSNMGTCSELAERVAQSLGGKMRVDVCTLDSLLPRKDMVRDASAVVVICSSYNGTPPDNAVEFIDFVESDDKVTLASVFGSVPIAVFGAGNKQWSRTYQAVPTRIHAALVSAGAQPLLPLATGDADSDLDDEFETWRAQLVGKIYGVLGVNLVKEPSSATGEGPAYVLTPTRENPAATFAQVASDFSKRNGLFLGRVLENRELQVVEASGRSTRHIEVQLPDGLTYAAGDHLAVLAGNPPEVVERAARLLGEFPSSAYTVSLAVKEKSLSNIIPLNVPLTLGIILTWCVELQLTATRAQISYLIAKCKCPPERAALEKLLTAYETEVHKPRRTVLEVLEAHRSIKPTVAEFLTILPPLKPRFYSISSSPKSSATRVSVTVGVVKGVSPTGREHVGVCSNFLARRMVGEPLRVFIKDTRTRFRLPEDSSVPVIMVGPGTGVAPFRGFLQELEARKGADNKGQALLFFGCRNEDCHLYREEMDGFVQRGVLSGLYVAYSRPKGGDRGNSKVYVQQLIEDNAEQVGALLKANAHIYVCGEARHMAPDVRRAFAKIVAGGERVSAQDGVMMVDLMVADGRYHEDVWAS